MAHAICEGIWIRRMLEELKVPTNYTMSLLCDNKDVISTAKFLCIIIEQNMR